jgi:hypothetical protein
MALFLANSEAFASGAARYDYRAATIAETSPRIILTIAVGNYRTAAFVDTGGIYFICTPPFARRLRLDPGQGLPSSERIRWRGETFRGSLYRLPLTLPASDGFPLTVEVTAFVPQMRPTEIWNDELPCVLGLQGCLERLRFAVDPATETFYFGELGAAR